MTLVAPFPPYFSCQTGLSVMSSGIARPSTGPSIAASKGVGVPPRPAATGNPVRPRRTPWGLSLIQWVNPWYLMIILIMLATYAYLRTRAMQTLIGHDT